MTQPTRAEVFHLTVAAHNGQFHCWDIHGFLATTARPEELAAWLIIQAESKSYFGLREVMFPGFNASHQEALGATSRSPHTHERGRRHRPKPPTIAIAAGDDLLTLLGFKS